ncbi:hypothetical protein TNCV_1371521 [Trichonephila clavipes]|nr:hypothetical protein TNCV_1371521 [Trichonephila clavipes]
MAPGSRYMSGNTGGYRMPWTYHWAVMVPRINTRGTVYCRQWHPIPSHQLWERCVHCKSKEGLRRSPRGLHTRIRLSSLLRLNLDSCASLKTTWFHSLHSSFLLVCGITPNGRNDG